MLTIALPFSTSEWLAFLSAISVIFLGAGVMMFPGKFMGLLGLSAVDGRKDGFSHMRASLGGVWVGLGVACILLAQPFTYLALGLAFALAVLGRLISFVFDRSFSWQTAIATVYELAVAYFALKFATEVPGFG